jgi:hypothetical protein
MDSGAVCEALSRKSPVKSESLARGGVMTMILCGNLDVALLVCLCLGSQVGCGGVPSVVVFHNDIGALYEFSSRFPANEPVNSLLPF